MPKHRMFKEIQCRTTYEEKFENYLHYQFDTILLGEWVTFCVQLNIAELAPGLSPEYYLSPLAL